MGQSSKTCVRAAVLSDKSSQVYGTDVLVVDLMMEKAELWSSLTTKFHNVIKSS